MATREWYGIDAPGVVRLQALAGAALLLAALILTEVVPGSAHPLLAATLRDNALWAGGMLLFASAWMLASSLWMKPWVMRRLLAEHSWTGGERVLDIGCGRGLSLIGAARHLGTGGHATGIDLWQASDLSDNGPDATRANAVAAGVADRVTIDTGDARALPYADASFDVVSSMTVIHNIPDEDGRRRAIAEAWRVLRPGGQALIYDIRHARRYADWLSALGAADLHRRGPFPLWMQPSWYVLAKKGASPTPGQPHSET